MQLLTAPFRAIRDFVAVTRFKQAQLKGKVCPGCGGRKVTGEGRTRETRRCRSCGRRWQHGGGGRDLSLMTWIDGDIG